MQKYIITKIWIQTIILSNKNLSAKQVNNFVAQNVWYVNKKYRISRTDRKYKATFIKHIIEKKKISKNMFYVLVLLLTYCTPVCLFYWEWFDIMEFFMVTIFYYPDLI